MTISPQIRPILLTGLALLGSVLLWPFACELEAAQGDLQIQFVAPGTKLQDLPKPSASLSRILPNDWADVGDHYTLPGKGAVRLWRSKSEVAVHFTEGIPSEEGLREIMKLKSLAATRVITQANLRKHGSIHLLRAAKSGNSLDPKVMRASDSVAYAYPVLIDPKTKMRMTLTDEVLVSFAPTVRLAEIKADAAAAGLQIVERTGAAAMNTWRLRLLHPKKSDPLLVSRTLALNPHVRWSQPNFVREIRHFFTPVNSLFADQQALKNTGQNHGVAGADVDAEDAWDTTTGDSAIVIAIIDDGVDIQHPALRIYTNPGESGGGNETDGVDNDGNGKIDDVHGWDFANDDNDVTPVGGNGHGTGTAGIAAATFGSQSKTAGIAGGCTILPVKIADDTGSFTTDDIIGSALVYAADHADVLSNSWGGGTESPFIDAAIDYAVTQGRHGKGCPVFFATGNSASTWDQGGGRVRLSTQGLSGSYYYAFDFEKGPGSAGEDAVRIDDVCVLDADGYTHKTSVLPDEDFENAFILPPYMFLQSGFWQGITGSGATTYWTLSGTNAFTGTGGSYSAVSPPLADGEFSALVTPPLTITGAETVAFAASVSIAEDSAFYIVVFDGTNGNFLGYYGPWNGPPDDVSTDTSYPASYVNSIAVGAATDCGLRSDYSEYDSHLDFVAPSNGGWNDIATLDPLGATGWTPDDFKMNFGGTSAATPLAAGIAALMLSVNPNLRAAEIRDVMHATCDQIGGVTYTSGTNRFYGYGRVNARKAVTSSLSSIHISNATVAEPIPDSTTSAVFTLTLPAPAAFDVTVNYSTADGSALAGTDYISQSGTVTFPAGSISQTITVTVNGSQMQQPYRSFLIDLGSPVSALLTNSHATAYITALDSDGDGMPDYWENSHGFSSADPADAALDNDGDGMTNLQEFHAGTDPNNPGDYLHVLATEGVGTDFRITFHGIAGRTYRVERTASLLNPDWQLVAVVAGTDGDIQVLDPGAFTEKQQQFYHVLVLPLF